ncbi:DUF4157 domain-containing protein [Micromonospora sp. A200]|uniref:eCIS core domain-containing protein n=1 Tax=Micromonospora sp. A200 TaxID=2940568 RepID=UPI002473E54D|nr:DUF4157 domain-containing protein [Micromonospora sp. A200]
MLALQRTAGNAAVARLLGRDEHRNDAARGHAAPVQRSAVHDVLRNPGRPLDGDVRAEMEQRLGTDFSDVRLHTDAAGHAAAESVQAEAFTSGSHIAFQRGRFDPSSAAGRHVLAHELTHVVQQRSGPVTGTATDDGLRVSDPSDAFERAAEANAARAMARPLSTPASAARPDPATTGSGGAADGPGTVQRMPKKDKGRKKTAGSSSAGGSSAVEAAPAAPAESDYEYVMRQIGDRVEGFAELEENPRQDLLAAVGLLNPDDMTIFLDRDQVDADLDDLAAQVADEFAQRANRPGYQVSGGRSDWASSRTTAEHAALRETPANQWGSQTTLHHKISRSNLKELLAAAEAARPASDPLFTFLEQLTDRVGSTGHEKLLYNMPANLEMGPASDIRRTDPGSGFDPNHVDGRMTPRSSHLVEVDRMITAGSYDWQRLAELLEAADAEHRTAHRGQLLSPPRPELWEKAGAKYEKKAT